MSFSKPIFTSLSPNTEKDDIVLALRMILRIILRETTRNKTRSYAEELEKEFERYLGVKYSFAFNSGRAAFLAVLNSLGLEEDEEVLLQGFTCNAAVNPVIWSGLKPIFVDIREETLNIDPEDLERRIGNKSRAILVQHTFGLPADLDRILEICQRHNLILVEDCAHSLGATYKLSDKNGSRTKKIGIFGKAAFFSFGRDKIISSVYGGMAVTNDDVLAKKIRNFQEKCDSPSNFWVFQQLLHPILTNYLIIPLYGLFGLGRWALLTFQKLKILSKAVHKKEKRGERPVYIPKKMPNALAYLALNQFKKLERFIFHQTEIAELYDEKLSADWASEVQQEVVLPKRETGRIYMRYPILLEGYDTDEVLKKARKQKIFLDDGWRKTPIVPPDTDQEKMGYNYGSCPRAEKVAKKILNLPTHINISKKDAQRIVDFLHSLNH